MNNNVEYATLNVAPLWLWHTARISFVVLILLIAALVLAIWFGIGNPPPQGALRWEDRFEQNRRWQMFGTLGEFNRGGLLVTLTNRGDLSGAVTAVETATPFTLEAAATQVAGARGAWYGLIINYQNDEQYTTILVNNNGYVELVEYNRKILLPAQEFPHVQLGAEANRIRIDTQGTEGVIRLNDEVLTRIEVRGGKVGVLARATHTTQGVRFNWVKFWSEK